MMGWISVALIWRISAKISDTAPARMPIAAARPPLVLPGFVSPRSIILISSMAPSFPNFRNYSNSEFQKSSLTLISEYQKYGAINGIVGRTEMQSTDWAPEHSNALREYLAKGMSYSEIAEAINEKFKTAYSRNATIGRAKRMGLAGPDRPRDLPGHWPKRPPKASAPRLPKLCDPPPLKVMRP